MFLLTVQVQIYGLNLGDAQLSLAEQSIVFLPHVPEATGRNENWNKSQDTEQV